MSKEYGAGISRSQPGYSSMNSYGANGSSISVVSPVLASFTPEIFTKMTPHPLPHWMTPNKIVQDPNYSCPPCRPYSCLSGPNEKCDRY